MAKIQIKNSFITSSAQITISSSLVRFSDNIRARGITGSFSGSIAGANVFVQGGNSFGTTATLGTNDNQVLVFETNNTERIRIQSDGNVGIGTTTVGALLAVNGDAFFAAKITIKGSAAGSLGNSSGLQLYQDSGTDTSYLYNYYAGSMVFGTSNVERMRILSGGNVGIGTSSPGFLLDVVSTSATPKLRIGNAGSNNGAQLILAGSNTTKNWVIANQQNVNGALEFTQTTANGGSSVDTTPSMVINSSGYIGMGITNPSAKLHIYNNTQHLQSTISGSTSINAGTFAIQIAPLARTYGANIYYPGIAFNHLLNYSSTTYNNSPQAWIGTRFLDYTGSERDALVFATKSGTGVSGTGNDIPVERMCIDYNGNLGIGTTTPTQRLDLSGSLRIRSAGTYSDPSDNAGFINYDSTGGIFTLSARSNGGNTYMAFRTSNSGTAGERMRIINDGNVGIGTTSPASKLSIAGSSATNFKSLILRNGDGTVGSTVSIDLETSAGTIGDEASMAARISGIRLGSGTTGGLIFSTTNSGTLGERVRITNDGNVGIGTTSPLTKLNLSGGSGAVYQTFTDTTNAYHHGYIGKNGGGLVFGFSSQNGSFSADEKMRIDTTGNLGIGTTSPNSKLEIYSTANEPAIRLTSTATATKTFGLVVNPAWAVGSFHIYDYTLDYSRLQVASDGNVGIGVGASSPSGKLEVYGATSIFRYDTAGAASLYLRNWTSGGTAQMIFGVASGDDQSTTLSFASNIFSIGNYGDPGSEIRFGTRNSSTADIRVTINQDGNVGVGTTSPSYKMDVSGSVRVFGPTGGVIIRDGTASKGNIRPSVSNGTILISDDSSSNTRGLTVNNNGGVTISTANASQNIIEGQANGSQVMCLNYSGNIGLGTSSPAQKLHVIGDSIFNGLKTIQLDRTLAAAVNSYTDIGNFVRNHGAHSMTVYVTANISGYSISKTYIINNAYNATGGSWRVALPIEDSGPYGDDFQLLANFDLATCYLRLRKSSGSTYTGAYSITILYTGYTDATFTATSTTGTDSSSLPILDSTQLIQVDGNVGIGTASPIAKLHVSGSSTAVGGLFNGRLLVGTTTGVGQDFVSVKFNSGGSYSQGINIVDSNSSANSAPYLVLRKSDDTYIGNIRRSSTDNAIYVGGNSYLTLGSGDTERMRIDSNGKVGIGTTLPSGSLTIQTNGVQLRLQTASGPGAYYSTISSLYDSTHPFSIAVAGNSLTTAEYFGIYADSGGSNPRIALVNGSVGIGTTVPISNCRLTLQSSNTARFAITDGTVTSNIWPTGGILYFSTETNHPIAFITNANERMRIAADGNVGIGTTSPSRKLHIKGTTEAITLEASYSGASGIIIGSQYTGTTECKGQIWFLNPDSGYGGALAFATQPNSSGTSATERMRIGSNGNVGIGTTTPNSRFEVSGSSNAAIQAIFQSNAGSSGTIGYLGGIQLGNASSNQNSQIYHNSSGDNTLTFVSNYGSGTSNKFVFAPGGTERVRFQQDGNVGIGTTSPSYKLHVNGGAANVAVGWFEKQSSTDGRIAHFTNSTATGYSSYIYIGSNPGTDWKVGKNVINSGTAGNFQITDHLDTVRFQINAADGNVGIGTTSPAYKLDVNSGGSSFALRLLGSSVDAPVIRYENTAGSGRTYHVGSTAPSSGAGAGFSVYDVTGNSARMLIDASGNLGIGTTSPIAKLHVSGSTMMMGDGGTFRPRQTIVGTKTGAASTTYTKIFSCGHTSTGIINVIAIITNASTASASATFSFANAFGLGASPNRISYVSLNSTITSIDCIYNNTGYIMTIAVTYSGATAPTLYFTAEGMGSENWAL